MSECQNSVDFWVEELTKDTDPDHFDFHEKFIPYMYDKKICGFGNWMWNNGYNVGLFDLQTKVNTYCVPQWISVKDKLPDRLFEDVLTYDGREIRINWLEELIDDTFYFAYGESITHWMPLPQKPESEDDAECPNC